MHSGKRPCCEVARKERSIKKALPSQSENDSAFRYLQRKTAPLSIQQYQQRQAALPSPQSIAALRNSASVMPAFFAASRKEIMPSLTSSVSVSHRPLFFPCSRPCSMPSRLVTSSAVSRSHFMLVMSYTSACRHRAPPVFILSFPRQKDKGNKRGRGSNVHAFAVASSCLPRGVPLAGSIMGNRE